MTADKLVDREQVERFLRGLGLQKPEEVIRQVVRVLRKETASSLYRLYTGKREKDGSTRTPICGKGTVYKVKKLYEKGELARYLAYLDSLADIELEDERNKQDRAGLLTSTRAPSAYEERPEGLRIESTDFRAWPSSEGVWRNVACLRVRNTRVDVPKVSHGFLEVIAPELPQVKSPSELHWTDTEPILADQTAEPAEILPTLARDLDVCFTILPEEHETNQAADTSPSPVEPGTASATTVPQWQGVSQRIGEPMIEHPMLSAYRAARRRTGGKGCWIATGRALIRPDTAGQAYLPPGECTVLIRVLSDEGVEDVKIFRLTSPETWEGLRLEEMED